MAKSKGQASKPKVVVPKPTGRPKAAEAPKHNVLSIRGSTEWRDWLNDLSEHCRSKAADVIDRALVLYAKQEGFTKPAPKR